MALDCESPTVFAWPWLTRSSDYQDQVWIWENEEGTFYFDVGEVVRFRVEMEEWHDQIPNAPDLGDGAPIDRKPPYSIIVRTNHWNSGIMPF
jgi:DNA-directed RNA polymerase III subunit RPC8